MKKICLITNLHISNNPRLWKEANSLAENGFTVVILTTFTSSIKVEQDLKCLTSDNINYKPAINLIPGDCSPVTRFWFRLRGKVARLLKSNFGIDSPWLLGYAPNIMVNAAMSEDADLYIAHSEFGIYLGTRLLEKGKNVAFDIEDWYSRDYLGKLRPVKLFESLESNAIKNGVYCTCPSKTMATNLEMVYPFSKKVHVLYNSFSIKEASVINYHIVNNCNDVLSLVWFSRTIGPDRGIETVVEALQFIDYPVELNLIGEPVMGYKEKIGRIFPFSKGHKVVFHPSVSHSELLPLISKFNIGLAIENDTPDNKNFTISNKAFQYLQAGVKILATNTQGQEELANQFPYAFELVPIGRPELWAKAITKLKQIDSIDKVRQNVEYSQKVSWEVQEIKLLALVKKALSIT